MKAKESAAFGQALGELQSSGLLLASDVTLPSVAGLVAEAPLRGSWWAHPQAHAIYRVAKQLAAHPDVLTAKLISGKVTFVHRRLWTSLFAVATSGEPWQLRGISPLARKLLSLVTKKGRLRIDRLPAFRGVSAKALGEAARGLERRLLAFGESIHTERGSHAKQLESWDHLARRVRLTGRKVAPQMAKKNFEEIAAALKARFRTTIHLPWKKI